MKKLLPLLLSVVVVISILAGVALSSTATDAEPVYYVSGDYTYVLVNSTDAKIVGYSGADTELSVPETLDGYIIVGIDDFAFMQNTTLKSVTLPLTISNVGEYAFLETELDSVTFLNEDCVIFDSEYTVSPTATIYGYDNSTAQAYAEKYERTFESLGEVPVRPTYIPTEPVTQAPTGVPTEIPTDIPSETTDNVTQAPTELDTQAPTQELFILGDVDGDKDVSVMDATAIQLHVASLQPIDEDKLPAGDADRDGDVSVLDATQIQLFVAKLIDSL